MIDMNDFYLISTLAVSSILSIWLFYYDVKHFKLPNIGVLALALLAFLFNYLNNFTLVSLNNMFVGAIVGQIDGWFDGIMVGIFDGTFDGINEGWMEGGDDGMLEG